MTSYELITSHQERLDFIIKTAFDIICKKIASDSITIFNEASLQLHLGTVLKDIGHLYEFSKTDRFVIELEKSIGGFAHTSKSKGNARCDIAVSYEDENGVRSLAFIELKYFKASKDQNSAEATKDNRFSLFMDLENLEKYRSLFTTPEGHPLCYEIALAQNDTYANSAARSVLKTGNGCWTDESRVKSDSDPTLLVRYTSKKPIDLKGNYQFEWKSYAPDKHCLMIKMQ